jgi:hypothetical protein
LGLIKGEFEILNLPESSQATNANTRAVCVYDTAEEHNPAHGEMAQSQYIIEEADRAELRHDLFQAFSKGMPVHPRQYREGTILEQLPPHLKHSVTGCPDGVCEIRDNRSY